MSLNQQRAKRVGVKMAQLVGKVMRKNAEVITLFKVDGKYYPATGENCEAFEAYLHTGDELYLQGLTNEITEV
jgi:uncharacterized protein (DUF927 family)